MSVPAPRSARYREGLAVRRAVLGDAHVDHAEGVSTEFDRPFQELITEGVATGDFRGVNAAFAADLAATMMVRIQQGRVRAATGLDDASAYRELASILTTGVTA